MNLNSILEKRNIHLVIGRELNKNKNPVAEKSIRELTRELLIVVPNTSEITSTSLAIAVANLNARVRAPGLSAHELWTQRDQVSGEQLPFNDEELISSQHQRRKQNHPKSELSKSGGKAKHQTPNIKAGSLVYLYADKDKEHHRPRYLVVSVNQGWCKLRRFTKKYFGFRTYDAKLEECFTVPVDNTKLPKSEEILPQSESDSETEDEDNTKDKYYSVHKEDSDSSRSEISYDSDSSLSESSEDMPDKEMSKSKLSMSEEVSDDSHNEPVETEEVREPVEEATQLDDPPKELVQVEEGEETHVKKQLLKKKAGRKKVQEENAEKTESVMAPRPRRNVKVPDKWKDYVME